MLRIVLVLALVAMAKPPKPKPPKTDRCLACDAGVHHPGRSVKGCNCSVCGSGTGNG